MGPGMGEVWIASAPALQKPRSACWRRVVTGTHLRPAFVTDRNSWVERSSDWVASYGMREEGRSLGA